MKVEKISHVGIAVPSIEEYLKVFEGALGLELTGTEEVAEQNVKVAFLQVGESRLELLEPLGEEGPVAKFIAKNGGKPKFHHIALEVDNVVEALAKVKADGLELIDETPRTGAGGAQIAFIHPKSSAGVLTELCQHTDKNH